MILILIAASVACLCMIILVPSIYFPKWVDRTRNEADAHPMRTTLLGAVSLLVLVAAILGFLGSDETPFLIIVTLPIICVLLIAMGFGFAAMAQLTGDRLTMPNGGIRPTLIGGGILTAACLTPFVGWFGLFPYVLSRGTGASLRTIFGRRSETKERNSAGSPAVSLPAVVLFFLSPAIAELLSSSAPPVEFFNPVGFILLSALYGSGAVIIRELTFRWGKGWPTVLALGAAYGILEEGLMVKSFFDPNWVDIGILGEYGRWVGINWVWSVHLTIYHAIISIAIPILLVNWMFPEERSRSWIGNRTFNILCILLGAVTAFGFFLLTPYRPHPIPYLFSAAVMIALFLIARRLPKRLYVGSSEDAQPVNPLWFGITAFIATTTIYLLAWILPSIGVPSLVTILIELGLVVLCYLLITRFLAKGQVLSPRHELALATGALCFFILMAPFHVTDQARPDDPTGMGWVGLAAAILLIWLNIRVRRSETDISDDVKTEYLNSRSD